MVSSNSKEKLEQELRFLKESFDAEVISKEEFEKGKERVEIKLKEFNNSNKNHENLDEKPLEKKKEEPQKKEEPKPDPKEELKEEKKEEKVESKKKASEDAEEQAKPAKKISEKKEKSARIVSDDEDLDEEEPESHKKPAGFWTYFWIAVVVIIILFGAYALLKNQSTSKKNQSKLVYSSDENLLPICNTDSDCIETGKIGKCINPSTKDAKCEFTAIEPIKVTVINAKECFNCDLSRVLSILNEWVGPVEAVEVDYNSEQGRELIQDFNVEVLPYYIVDEKVTGRESFSEFARAFSAKNSSYILSEGVASPSFYYKRQEIPNKLDFFVIKDGASGIRAEKNLEEFLKNFPNVKFEKHFSDSSLSKELKIKSFPSFVVNNRIRFSGVYPAETIKENFCKANELKECDKSLTKSLI